MNNSQSSDVFSENELSHDRSTSTGNESYKILLSDVRKLLSGNVQRECKNSTFLEYITPLEDSKRCVTQSLDFVIDLLGGEDINITRVYEYLDETTCILQMLSNFIKNVVQSISMSCCIMKTFPTTTGQIILTVFTHCKDSELIYGQNLNYVEKQLKELFRMCHELQLTYLMILENHFVFDVTNKEEQDILIETMQINLNIGEIAQILDVKTMAEQWKAFTGISEKYSCYLSDSDICDKCTYYLCAMIESNTRTALQTNQEQKVMLRSLKVTNFTIKILLKICTIFKKARIDCDRILELLLNVYSICCQRSSNEKIADLVHTNILTPIFNLLREILGNDAFVKSVIDFDLDSKDDERLLGYIILLTDVMQCVLKHDDLATKASKSDVVDSIFRILPNCHIWFNMDLQFKVITEEETVGLFEKLLIHTFALSCSLDSEEFTLLEQNMYEAILGTDCYTALFASSLWGLLARKINEQLLLDQVNSLCQTFLKLENYRQFRRSPQESHLRHTISRLFRIMRREHKIIIHSKYNFNDNKNIRLWSSLKIKNLPKDLSKISEDLILGKAMNAYQTLENTDVNNLEELCDLITLCSSCDFEHPRHGIDEEIMNWWSKACPDNFTVPQNIDKGNIWFTEYVQAVVDFTIATKHLYNTENILKMLHITKNLIKTKRKDLKLILINFICEGSYSQTWDESADNIELVTQIIILLSKDEDTLIRTNLLHSLRKSCEKFKNVIDKCCEKKSFNELWSYLVQNERLTNLPIKEQLKIATYSNYSHKCLDARKTMLPTKECLAKSTSSNFDFADIDTLFCSENGGKPVCKKAKLTNEVDDIIGRLENESALLCRVKENVFTCEQRNRIRDVCENLRNVIN